MKPSDDDDDDHDVIRRRRRDLGLLSCGPAALAAEGDRWRAAAAAAALFATGARSVGPKRERRPSAPQDATAAVAATRQPTTISLAAAGRAPFAQPAPPPYDFRSFPVQL